jgi:multisubunit Na+/H+ antiporter MnhE subunit
MLRAVAAFIGLFLIWLLLTGKLQTPAHLAWAAGAAALSLWVGVRLAGAVSPVFAGAAQFLLLGLARAGLALRACLSTLRAALAADVALAPALARLKTRSANNNVRAELANLISATPGAVVVDADAEGLLMHLINEDALETADYAGLEAHVASALGARALP